VLSQTYADFELIVIDDGSTDDSQQVIAAYQGNPRVRAIFHQENRGQAAAFNTGFANSRGTLVAFLDSDDAWKPEKLAKIVAAFEDGDLSVVQHNLEVIDARSRPVGRVHPGIRPGVADVLKEYFRQNHTGFFTSSSGVVCRRAHLEHIFPLPESWRICADIPLTRPLPTFGQVCTLEEPLGYYRIHGSNTWMNTAGQRQRIENEQRYVDFANEWLARCGYAQRIDLEKSGTYRRWYLERLPSYHPRRLRARLWLVAAQVVPEPAKALYRRVRRGVTR